MPYSPWEDDIFGLCRPCAIKKRKKASSGFPFSALDCQLVCSVEA